MTYIQPQYYTERYVVNFDDVMGTRWKISIQSENWEGQITELIGSDTPVEWMGVGDESQDEVVLGCTGTIRLVCMNSTQRDNIYKIGELLPTIINDRRVQIFRYMKAGNEWVWQLYFQGFIVPQTFSQDWDTTPYEIELPIVSTVAAMEYFTMPLPGDNCYDSFDEVTNIAMLLRRIFSWCGCDIRKILTNKPFYQDFNGFVYENHWSQGILNSIYFYDFSEGRIKPKTFKDVLETICYPWGKINDFGSRISIAMRWKEYQEPNNFLYSLTVWEDYDLIELNDDQLTFAEEEAIRRLYLDDIRSAGTDNKTSIILPPSRVDFSSDAKYNKTIFDMTEDIILPTFIPQAVLPDFWLFGDGSSKYVFPIHIDFVDTSIFENWSYTGNYSNTDLLKYPFCRVALFNPDTNTNTFNVAVTSPIAIAFNIPGLPDTSYYAEASFTVPIGVRTTEFVNLVKISLKPFRIMNKEEDVGSASKGEELYIYVQDLSNNKYLSYDSTNNTLVWTNAFSYISSDDLNDIKGQGSEFYLAFNEERSSSDTTLHKLKIGLRVQTYTGIGITHMYGRMYVSLKIEYAPYDKLQIDPEHGIYFNQDAIFNKVGEGIFNHATIANENGGLGELSIGMPTRCGNKRQDAGGAVISPYNGFCDYPQYIDMGQREMIEIDSAEFERYYSIYYFDMITSYSIVLDGDKVYIPVAVGMNPRMNTMRLRLISTNVTAQEQ